MVTVMNQGNPGVKTYLNGAHSDSTVTNTVHELSKLLHTKLVMRILKQAYRMPVFTMSLLPMLKFLLYNSVNAESGAVVINVDNVVPFNAGVASVTQPAYSVTVKCI